MVKGKLRKIESEHHCPNCSIDFEVVYYESDVTTEKAAFCPFCGEDIEDLIFEDEDLPQYYDDEDE